MAGPDRVAVCLVRQAQSRRVRRGCRRRTQGVFPAGARRLRVARARCLFRPRVCPVPHPGHPAAVRRRRWRRIQERVGRRTGVVCPKTHQADNTLRLSRRIFRCHRPEAQRTRPRQRRVPLRQSAARRSLTCTIRGHATNGRPARLNATSFRSSRRRGRRRHSRCPSLASMRPSRGYHLVPSDDAIALADYMLALKRNYPLPISLGGEKPAAAAAPPPAAAARRHSAAPPLPLPRLPLHLLPIPPNELRFRPQEHRLSFYAQPDARPQRARARKPGPRRRKPAGLALDLARRHRGRRHRRCQLRRQPWIRAERRQSITTSSARTTGRSRRPPSCRTTAVRCKTHSNLAKRSTRTSA